MSIEVQRKRNTIKFSGGVIDDPKSKENKFEYLSPSKLATLEQCPRAFAIERDPEMAKAAHKDLADDMPNYKMIFGKAFHKVVELADDNTGIDEVVAATAGNLPQSGWDTAYCDVDDMAKGIKNALQSFWQSEHCLPWKGKRREKARIEQNLDVEIDGMKFRGIVDMITDQGEVQDIKTTTKGRQQWHGSQLGAYWMMAKKAGMDVVNEAKVVKVYRPRVPNGKSGVDGEWIDAAEQVRHIRRLTDKAKDIRDTMDKWKDNYTAIENNPSAAKCRYCSARATSACPETRTW